MKKRFIASAGVVLAFLAIAALPAVASANLYTGATQTPVGTKVVGEGYVYLHTGGDDVYCNYSGFSGEVVKNEQVDYQISVPSMTFGGEAPGGKCKSFSGQYYTVYMTNIPRLCFRGTLNPHPTLSPNPYPCGYEGSELRFKTEVLGIVCEYVRNNAIPFWGTSSNPWTISTTSQPFLKASGGGFCTSEIKVDMNYYKIATAGGVALSWKQ